MVGVAFGCQVLALLTLACVHLCCYVVLHNAMLHGELAELSNTWKMAVPGLLMVSVIWTYSVLRVSNGVFLLGSVPDSVLPCADASSWLYGWLFPALC